MKGTIECLLSYKPVYLVKLVWWCWLDVATRHVYFLSIVIEIYAGHSSQDGTHHTGLTSILRLLGLDVGGGGGVRVISNPPRHLVVLRT